jgi:ubiquinone biosynthesis protein
MTMLSLPVVAAVFVLTLATALSVSMFAQGDQIDRVASSLMVGTGVACLIICISTTSSAGDGPRISGLPSFGLLGFLGAIAGIWVLTFVWRNGRKK